MKVGCKVALTLRDLRVLDTLGIVGAATSEQLGKLAGFSSKTRRNERLLKLVRAGILGRSFVGTISGGRAAVYALAHGKGHRASPLRAGNASHRLAITEVYVSFAHSPSGNRGDPRLRFERSGISFPEHSVVPDAYLEVSVPSGTRAYFLEVDLGTEALSHWTRKAARYLEVASSGSAEVKFGHPSFGVLVVAHSARRLQGIRRAVRTVSEKIFYFTDMSKLTSEGACSPIWLRPEGESCVPLT